MGAKDCLFTISFILSMVLGILYIVSFASKQWVSYELTINGHKETGNYGLWKKCATNQTDNSFYCTHTHLAQGPRFLEVSRTLACFGLVFVVGCMMGYIFADHTDATGNILQKIRFRLQEICSMLAGILGTNSSSIHMRNSEDHYKEDLQTEDVEIGAIAILMLVVSILLWLNSILLWSTRPCPDTCKKPSTARAPTPAPKSNEADSRKKWLSSSAMPTPVEQKAALELTPTQKSHGLGHQDTSEDVEVKKGWSRSIVAPTQVILAIKRLRKGEKRHSGDKEKPIVVAEDRAAAPVDEPNNKFKGIFTVAVDNKPSKKSGPAPPIPPPILATPRRRVDSTSSSSSSSSGISIEATHVSKTNQKTGGATKSRPAPVIRHFSQNEAEIRARAQQAAVVVTDEASLKAAQDKPRPKISKRHATHQETSLRTAVGNAASSDGNTLNIYHIPDEPVAHDLLPPPSNYVAV